MVVALRDSDVNRRNGFGTRQVGFLVYPRVMKDRDQRGLHFRM
jgi:hypothetical protein